jgi:hypothetical protein
MPFQPVIPFGGMAGWAFLQRTRAEQQQVFEAAPSLKRDTDYFLEKIGATQTAEALVNDYRLLKVALGAFGLDADIGNKAFIQRVLEDGSLSPDALANKLSDKRYLGFAKAFGFGDFTTPSTRLSNFGATIVAQYKSRQFEIAVGEGSSEMRLAMSLERELGTILAKTTTSEGMWYSVMGSPPLRKVFETAMGLPASFGTLDLDLQLAGFRRAAMRTFGNPDVAQFADTEKQEDLTRLFLVRSEINAGAASMSSGQVALTLLQNAFG